MEEKNISESESLLIIQNMIDRARNSIVHKGTWPIYWGALITFCSLFLFVEIKFDTFLPFDIFLITLPALLLQIIIISYQRSKNKNKPKSVGICQKAIKYCWIAFAIGMILISFAPGGNNQTVYFVLYGIPTFVTGSLIDFKPMTIGGIICWLCAVATYFLERHSPYIVLMMALSATTAWLIPGLIMRVRYLSVKKGQHV